MPSSRRASRRIQGRGYRRRLVTSASRFGFVYSNMKKKTVDVPETADLVTRTWTPRDVAFRGARRYAG